MLAIRPILCYNACMMKGASTMLTSSMLAKIEHDGDTLIAYFNKGTAYRYETGANTDNIYSALANCEAKGESSGKLFHALVIKAEIPFIKIEG